MDNLSVQLHEQPIGCSLGTAMVIHMIYAADLLLFTSSAKGLQTLLDIYYTYGCEHDIQYNVGKFFFMYVESRNINIAREITLEGNKLNVATSYKYFVEKQIFSNLLSFIITPTGY